MNKKEFNVIREEFSRAVMIQQARKMLNEASFNTFLTELKKYEENTIINESVQSGTYYDNFFSNMNEGNILLEAAPEMPPEVEEEEEEKAEAPDGGEGAPGSEEPAGGTEAAGPSREEIEQEIADRLQKYKQEERDKKWQYYSQKAKKALQTVVVGNVVAEAEWIIKNKENFETSDELEAIGKLRVYYGDEDFAALFNEDGTRKAQDPAKDKLAAETAKRGGAETVKNREGGDGGGDAEKALDDAGKGLDTPKAQGIWGAIKDNYLKAFQFMPALLGAGIRKLNQIGRAQPQNQDNLLLQLLLVLLTRGGKQQQGEEIINKVQNNDVIQNKSEEPIGDDPVDDNTGGEDGEKVNKVADLQDKIILTLNKVLDTKNVDMSRKDTMELAKKITKNLVDQMLANGIKFKGMEAQIAEAVVSGLAGRILLREEEGEEEGKPKKEKPENDRVQKLIRMRVRRFSMSPSNFLNGLKKVRREFAEKEYGKKEIFRQYINSDVEQEFVGLYDAYLDVMALGKAYKELTKKAKEDKSIANALAKADSQIIMVAGKKVKGRKISSLVVHFANFYRLASDDNQAPDHPAQLKKYAEFKKKAVRQQKGGKDAKDMYKPEKVPDAKLPQGKKGEINVKNLIFQALKGMEITGDQAKDIESLLNKRLQSVAKQYIAKGMEIRVLEEKLNRYTVSVIKELKNAM